MESPIENWFAWKCDAETRGRKCEGNRKILVNFIVKILIITVKKFHIFSEIKKILQLFWKFEMKQNVFVENFEILI